MSTNKEVVELLSKALEKGIAVFQEEEKLKFRVAKNKIVDPEILDSLKANKSEILEFLSAGKVPGAGDKITPFGRSAVEKIPLSFSQERLWFIDQYGGSVQYHLPTVLRLGNALDRDILEAALSALVDRHEVLRTVIRQEDGQPYQLIRPADAWKMEYSEGVAFEDQEYLRAFIAGQINRPFDLANDYMLRARLVNCGAGGHVLILVMHHIASDGWSNGVLVKDLIELYSALQEGRPHRLPGLPIQYADYALWQRRRLGGDVLERQLDWWEGHLSGVEPLELPTDFPRPAQQSTRGAGLVFHIEKNLAEQLKELSFQAGATLFMALLAAFKVLLYRYSGQEDICVGTPLANRGRKELEQLAGFFVNTLALRSQLGGNPEFLDFLAQLKATTLAAFEHQHVPFERIVDRVEASRSLSHNPLFQVMFILQNAPETPDLRLGGLSLSSEPAERTTTLFDLIFSITETPRGLLLKIIYGSELYEKATIERMSGHFITLLQGIAANPRERIGRLPMLTEAEKRLILDDFNHTEIPYPSGMTVIGLFERQAVKTPERTALLCEGRSYTYRELNERANQLARYILANSGFQAGDSVAVMMERSEWYVLAMIGIMKLGGVYVPIEVAYPDERIRYILKNSGSRVLITRGGEKVETIAGQVDHILDLEDGAVLDNFNRANLKRAIDPRGAAFVIYTSGSTGAPKGVEQTHLMLYNLIQWTIHESGQLKGARYFQYSSFSFDMSLYESCYVLSTGGELHVGTEAVRRDLWELKDYLLRNEIAVISMPYSALKLIFGELGQEGLEGHSIKEIISAGEQLYISGGLRAFLKANPSVKIYNLYGPSETHVITGIDYSFAKGRPPAEASIGRPVSNTVLYILDREMQPVPIGVEGEIYAGGHNLALGYKNDPARTAEKFIDDPFRPGQKIYKTGDLGKWQSDGNISFRGRKDDQIKIRGYRIELGEIESVLKNSGELKSAVVLARPDAEGELRLVAYVSPEKHYDRARLQAFLSEKLPAYMAPAAWVELEMLPLTSNGKVDKRALAALEVTLEPTREYVAPGNEREEALAGIWKELLHLERVGVHDNFFEIGGHSLLAMRLISAIRKELGQELKVKDIFLQPTISGLARQLAAEEAKPSLPPLLAAPRPERIPLSYSQERLWFIDQMEGSAQYHLPSVLRLRNKLDREALEAALAGLVGRHEVLRTVIKSEDGQPYQEILPAAGWQMAYSEGEAFSDEGHLRAFIAEQASRPFGLSADYMLRAHLIKCAPQEHVLVLVVHHIASDGWSQSLLVRDLMELYRARLERRPPQLPPLPIQYADYAIWQRQYLSADTLAAHLDWWAEQLKDAEPLRLPTDYPRPAVPDNKGASLGFMVEPELAKALKDLSVQAGASLFMALLAAFKVLLYRYSGQEDLCVGAPVANRNHQEAEALAGFFINTLVFRSKLDGKATFRELLEQVKGNVLSVFNHQEVPFEQVVSRVGGGRHTGRSPLFQALFVMQNTPEVPRLELGGLDLSAESPGYQKAMFDLSFSITESPGGIHVGIVYAGSLFSRASIEHMAAHFHALLASIASAPGQRIARLSMLAPGEEHRLLVEFNDFKAPYPREKTVIGLFEEQAARTPGHIALAFEGREWTYQALDEQAGRLAAHLQKNYAPAPESLIGVMMERSDWAVVAILGILKTGAAWAPIDVRYPKERKAFIIGDTGLKILLTDSGSGEEASGWGVETAEIGPGWAGLAEAEGPFIRAAVRPEDLAYVLYTSGTTGRPKGVMVEHGGLKNTILSQIEAFSITEADRCLQFISYSFDPSILEIFTALLSGATLCIVPEEARRDPIMLEHYIQEKGITVAILPAAYFRGLDTGALAGLRALITGGEPAPPEKVNEFLAAGDYYNSYGPTEASICATVFKTGRGEKIGSPGIPVGRPISNALIYILDEAGRPAPIGVAGELCIGGAGLARGYLNRPELTEEKFTADPFSPEKGARMFRTGDLARWRPDGQIEFLGRRDNQVKVNGHRVELEEVESVLNASPEVKSAAVMAWPAAGGGLQLAAYVVPRGAFGRRRLQGYLKSKLPDYMVPSFWVEMEALPLSPTGKVDKKALPEPEPSMQLAGEHIAPRSETEKILAGIWAELLQQASPGIRDNFFEIGGHSLLAMRLVSAIRNAFQKEIKVKDIFTHPTIGSLAPYLEGVDSARALPPIVAAPRPPRPPLSYSQERLWFIDQLRGSVEYHIPTVLRLRHELNKDVLSGALSALLTRHEALRTVIRQEDGQPYQEVLPAEDWRMAYSEGADFEEEEYLRAFIKAEVSRPFSLASDYMLRAHLVKCGLEDHLLILVVHHIAADGWSQSILVKDLSELYSAMLESREPALAPLAVQYVDYALWQRRYMAGEYLDAQLDWWEENLRGLEPLALPADYPRPPVQSMRGDSLVLRIERSLTDRLEALAQEAGGSLFMVLLTAFKVLLYRYSRQEDICVGASLANRSHREVEPLVGFFINTLALRSRLGGNPRFSDLLQQVRANTLSAYSRQDVPYEEVVKRVEARRDLSRSPLFQVMFDLQNMPEAPALELGGLRMSAEPAGQSRALYDLTFLARESPAGLRIAIEYCRDLFSRATIERMAGHFQALLASAAADPELPIGRLSMLNPGEEQELVEAFNRTETLFPLDKTLAGRFEEQAARTPQAVAVSFAGRKWTYQELNEQADKLAAYLQETYRPEPDSLVGIMLERSDWAVISILGALKAGAAYVPIDNDYPLERKAFMIRDAGLKILIVQSQDIPDLPGLNVDLFAIDVQLDGIELAQCRAASARKSIDNLAYIIYTSGSTGTPKGVMVEERSLLNYLFYCSGRYGADMDSFNFPLFTSLSFDLTQTSIFLSLLSGGTLLIESGNDIGAILERITGDPRVNAIKLTPSHVNFLEGRKSSGLSVAILGGEALEKHHVEKLKTVNPRMRIFNEYGPTEATIGCTVFEVEDAAAPILIGRPLANTQIYITDSGGGLAPVGAPGELCIGGAGLARGYLNRPELTAQKFIENPFGREKSPRIYKTGDLARWLPDGNIEFRGRIDEQVKIRGYRIELGEIESVLNESPLVKNCAVASRASADGSPQLAAYVVPERPGLARQDLQGFLKGRLPGYMIPALWVEMESLPLSGSGKVDKKALPEPAGLNLPAQEYVAPRSETERELADIWSQLLQFEKVGIRDNFFEIGGHSLLAVRVISAVAKSFRQKPGLEDVFAYPTVEQFARFLEEGKEEASLPPPAAGPRPEKVPLSYSQERLWFIDQLEGSVQYHIPTVLRLKDELDRTVLEEALRALIGRHEVLRTAIRQEDGQPCQELIPAAGWSMGYSEGLAFEEEGYLKDFIVQEINRPFNLAEDYMLRAHLIRCGAGEHVLALVLHHIASDGWSNSILVKDLLEFYSARLEGRRPALDPLPVQYMDYALWQRKHLSGAYLKRQLDWWEEQLRTVEPLALPTDFPRPSVQSTRGASYGFIIDKSLAEELKALSLQAGATLFMALLSAFKVLLHRYCGQEDICVGTPLANRNQQEVEPLVGFFINTLALRTQVGGQLSFMELLEAVKSNTLAAFARQEAPFEQVVGRLGLARSLSRSPVFQVMFVMQNMPAAPRLELGGLRLSTEPIGRSASLFDLNFSVTESPWGLQLGIEYCSDLFSRATIERMASHFQMLLRSAVSDPNRKIALLPMLSPEEERQLLVEFNDTAVAYPHSDARRPGRDRTVVDLFEEQVERAPHQPALVFEDRQWTYTAVNEAANRLARYILENTDYQQGGSVAVMMARSDWAAIAMIGIMKLGGLYVPVDSAYPESRIRYILSNSKAEILLTNGREAAGLARFELELQGGAALEPYTPSNLGYAISGKDPSYLIYTSGSTGAPKGVEQTHLMLFNLISWSTGWPDTFRGQRYFQYSSFSFDMSLYEIYHAWSTGGTVYISSEQLRKDLAAMRDYIVQQEITTLSMPYSALKLLFGALDAEEFEGHCIREIISAGEQLYISGGLRAFLKANPEVRMYNLYGPSETHVVTGISYRFADGEPPVEASIGKPVSNTEIYILDKAMQLAPLGVEGEIYIGGQNLALGYKGRPKETAARFVDSPFKAGERLYRSGDIGKWLPDGNIAYKGRRDSQVKINGYRIELGEIESMIKRSELIKSCVVLAREAGGGELRLAAYLVPGAGYERARLQAFLKANLPDYMMPAIWVEMEAFPLTTTGKVDRLALSRLDVSGQSAREFVAPRDETEERIAKVWKAQLHLDSVGVHDNFFEMGGHSLNAITTLFHVNKALKARLSLMELFSHPTIAGLAELVRLAGNKTGRLFSLSPGGKGLPKLFFLPPVLGIPAIFNKLAENLAGHFDCYGFQYGGIEGEEGLEQSIEHLAARFTEDILSVQESGEFVLCGYSMGGTVAFELAKTLERKGHEVALILMDRGLHAPEEASSEKIETAAEFYMQWLNRELEGAGLDPIANPGIKRFLKNNIRILSEYRVRGRLRGRILALEAREGRKRSIMKSWASMASGPFEHAWLAGGHYGLLEPRNLPRIKKLLLNYLGQPSRRPSQLLVTLRMFTAELGLRALNFMLFLHQKVSSSAPYWLNYKMNAREMVTPDFRLGQFFFTEKSAREVVDRLDGFDNPCCLCTPSLGKEWLKRGKSVRVLDIDKRFEFLPGYRYFDLKNPTYLGEAFDVIIIDPIFFPPQALLEVVDAVTGQNYRQKLAIVYKTSLEGQFLEVFKQYGLCATNYYPDYPHVAEAGRKEFMFYANFNL